MSNGETQNGKKPRYFGKYRGVVFNNVDPLQKGRLLVQVQDVLSDDPCIWADSASPVAGPQMGMYSVPPIGAGVWIEFEQGDPDYAVWSGSWRGSPLEVPAEAAAAPPGLPPIILQSTAQNRIVISSTPGDGIRLETSLGPMGPTILLSPSLGIVLSDGTGGVITLTKGVVTINQGALIIK